jgi:hypothetical protein
MRGWLAMAEEMAIEGTQDIGATDDLIALLVDNLEEIARQAALR